MITVHQSSAEFDAAAWDIIDEFAGVPMSYADATIVALARDLGLQEVFSFDSDLRLAGLTLVPTG
jgi:predicted nucleic acid-binding protein